MRSQCRVLVVENFRYADEVLSIIDGQAGNEVTVVADRDAALNELSRGSLKAPYMAAIIGGAEPPLDLKLAEFAALRGCVAIAAVADPAQREPFLARGYDLVDVPCRPEELIVRLAVARLRAEPADRRPRGRSAELRRRRLPSLERAAAYGRARFRPAFV